MTVVDRPQDPVRSTRWLLRHPGLLEFGIVGACLLAYFLIRGGVVNRPVTIFPIPLAKITTAGQCR